VTSDEGFGLLIGAEQPMEDDPQDKERWNSGAVATGCVVAFLGGFAGCTAQFSYDVSHQGQTQPTYILSGIALGILLGCVVGYIVNRSSRR
jgi:hypothetical protein